MPISEPISEYKLNVLKILDSFFQYNYIPKEEVFLNSDSSFSQSLKSRKMKELS